MRNLKAPPPNIVPKEVVALMDATYWGDDFGVVALKDNLSGHVLWYKFIERKERVEDYLEGVRWIEEKHHAKVRCVVADGLRGLKNRLSPRLFQHCQFHQFLTVKEYITSFPRLTAAKEFYALVNFMMKTDRATFEGLLGEWETKWKKVVNERTIGANGKSHYVHEKLRSAWRSVRRNMPNLWTFEEHDGLGIPRMNNGIESLFSIMKPKLRLHRGLSIERRKLLISGFLIAHSPYRTGAAGEIRSPFDT